MPFSYELGGIVARRRASETTFHQTVAQAHRLYYWKSGCTVGSVRHNLVEFSPFIALRLAGTTCAHAVRETLAVATARTFQKRRTSHVHTVLRGQVAPGSRDGQGSLVALATDLSRLSHWRA